MSLDDVWRAATPFLLIRKNDIHVPISFDYAERLLEEHPQAEGLVVRLAILLHDIRWIVSIEQRLPQSGQEQADLCNDMIYWLTTKGQYK